MLEIVPSQNSVAIWRTNCIGVESTVWVSASVQDCELLSLRDLWRHESELDQPLIVENFLWKGDHDIAKEVGLCKGVEFAAGETSSRSVGVAIKMLDYHE